MKEKIKDKILNMLLYGIFFIVTDIVITFFVITTLKKQKLYIDTTNFNLTILAIVSLGIIVICYYLKSFFNNKKLIPSVDVETYGEGENKIVIPKHAGNGQYGNAKFMSKSLYKEVFKIAIFDKNGNRIDENTDCGIVTHFSKDKMGNDNYFYLDGDIHSMIIGSTRSGKTRGLLLPTIFLYANSNENAIIPDPKGELFESTYPYFLSKGWNVKVFNIKSPEKSHRWNYLNEIINAIKENNISKQQELVNDLVNIIKPPSADMKEPFFYNGEVAVLKVAIMTVAKYATEECKNLYNCSMLIGRFLKQLEGDEDEEGELIGTEFYKYLKEGEYIKELWETINSEKPEYKKTFFSSARSTLQAYITESISKLTSTSDFQIEDLVKGKTVLYIVCPDERSTYYPLVSLFIKQAYIKLVELSDKKYGGRLPNRVNFLIEEMGNLSKILDFDKMLTVGGGRGLRFNPVLQGYDQLGLYDTNNHKLSETIKGNCLYKVYLKSANDKTLAEISKTMGNYTTMGASSGDSIKDKGVSRRADSVSSNISLMTRELMKPSELGKLESPNRIGLMGGKDPMVLHLPDLSKMIANKELGLGNPIHNSKVRIERMKWDKLKEVGIEDHSEDKIRIWDLLRNLSAETYEEKFTNFFNEYYFREINKIIGIDLLELFPHLEIEDIYEINSYISSDDMITISKNPKLVYIIYNKYLNHKVNEDGIKEEIIGNEMIEKLANFFYLTKEERDIKIMGILEENNIKDIKIVEGKFNSVNIKEDNEIVENEMINSIEDDIPFL